MKKKIVLLLLSLISSLSVVNAWPWMSPYAYCNGNPVRFVDPDGKKPRIYIQSNGLGHTFVTVGEGRNTIVYTYGRYGALGSSGSILHGLTPTGEGVLFKKTGAKALEFLDQTIKDGNVSIYEIENGSDKKVASFFDCQWNRGTRPTQKKAAKDSDAKVVDEYNLFDNNCTTKSIEAVNYNQPNSKVPFSRTITWEEDGVTCEYNPKIYDPADLKKTLDKVAKENPNDIIKVQNPQDFFRKLQEQMK